MLTFKNVCAQGDIYIRRIDKMPDGLIEIAPENGRHILAHSETGHHHDMVAERVRVFQKPGDNMHLFVAVAEPTALEHQRSHDTHAPILFDTGYFEVKRQREYTPEGFRRVED
jgi:hypothetical protein